MSLVLCAVSLMGLSQGDREQRGYEALSRAALSGFNDGLRTPGLEEPQQQPEISPSACGINSGSFLNNLNIFTVRIIYNILIFKYSDQN